MRWTVLGTVRQWHWISSALCLAAILLFAVTGFTLNHASSIEASVKVTEVTTTLPAAELETLRQSEGNERLPADVSRWLRDELDVQLHNRVLEWSPLDLYISMPRPGGDAWLSIELDDGFIIYERSSRGLIAYLNDLHKGRNSGLAWSLFIDIAALGCVIFAVTGLILLKRHASNRRGTWPLTSLGFVVPVLLLLLFSHF